MNASLSLSNRASACAQSTVGSDASPIETRFVALSGALTAFALLIVAGTGLLLTLAYRPEMDRAHASVLHIVQRVPFGWLVRGLHVVSAHAFVLFALAHFTLVWCVGRFCPAYRRAWYSGVVLLGLGAAAMLTGLALPWDERGLATIRVASSLLDACPGLGSSLASMLRDGPWVSAATIPRLFVLHVAWIPLAGGALFGAHLRGSHGCFEASRAGASRFFACLVVMNAMLWVAALVSDQLGPMAELLKPATGALAPHWLFVPAYQVVRGLPARVGSVVLCCACAVLGVAVLAAPLCMDRCGQGTVARRRFRWAIATCAWLCFLALLGWGYAHPV